MRVLLFGATGSAGGSVLKVCLAAPAVEDVRAIVRRPLAAAHAKLQSIPHADFTDFSAVADAFDDVDACLYCLGTSVTQVPEEAAYRRITQTFALAAAAMLKERTAQAAFHFVSGSGAALDSRFMWAKVKAETERDLIASVGAVCWRPGYIDGEPSTSGPRLYRWLRPVGRLLIPFQSLYVSGTEIGRAMLQATTEGTRGRIIENPELRAIARRAGPMITGN